MCLRYRRRRGVFYESWTSARSSAPWPPAVTSVDTARARTRDTTRPPRASRVRRPPIGGIASPFEESEGQFGEPPAPRLLFYRACPAHCPIRLSG